VASPGLPAPGSERPVPGPRSPVAGPPAAEWVVGFHAVLAALEHQGDRVEVVCIGEGTAGGRAGRVLAAVRAAGVRCHPMPRRQLDEIAAGAAHNGFAARLAPVALAAAGSLLEVYGPACLIGLDSPEDPHNLGAVVRVAAGLGLAGVVVSGPHPPPLAGAVAKVAAGTLPLVRLAHVGSLGDFARQAKDAGFWVVGAAMEGSPVSSFELPDRLLLCLGAEATGLRAKTRAALDATVAIPLAAGVESLNLSVATAILAWEWRRRFPGF
jgi:23S rRNA (guanosine2251-2'-O)-methyltransferase